MAVEVSAHLTSEPIDLAALIAGSEDDASGALAVFVGTVRNHNEGRSVSAITYEAHPLLAKKALAGIEVTARERFEIRSCTIVHRTGTLALGEASVAIIVRSAHRAPAFDALRFAIDELKVKAPIWKLEHYDDGGEAYLKGVSLLTQRQEER